jgi:hypothetical protein
MATAGEIGHIAGQDLPQPDDQLRLGLSLKLIESLVGLDQGLLHQVRRVRLLLQGAVDPHAGQEPHVVAVAFQQLVERAGLGPVGLL